MLFIAALSLSFIITPGVSHPELANQAWTSLEFIASEPRFLGSEHLRNTEEFIVARLQEAGFSPQVFEYRFYDVSPELNQQGTPMPSPWVQRDVFVQIEGTSGKSVMLFAHLDSFQPWIPGAIDSGMAVAALLEAFIDFDTRRDTPPEVGIQILFTDAHEVGFGAVYFIERHSYLLENTIFAIRLDGTGNGPLMLLNGRSHADIIFNTTERVSGFSLFSYGGGALDEELFINAGIPAVSLMSVARSWHYHSPTDNIENANLSTLGQHTDAVRDLMDAVSQEGRIEGFEPRETTFFMLGYGLTVSYGPLVKWIITVFALLSVVALLVHVWRNKMITNKKGIIIGLGGIALFVGLYFGIAYLLNFLVMFVWDNFANTRIDHYFFRWIFFRAGIMAITISLAYIGLKKLSRFTEQVTLRAILAVAFSLVGLGAAILAPGLEYFFLISAVLIVIRSMLPSCRITYYFTGIASGLIFIPLLYLLITQASPDTLTTVAFTIFILVFYVLSKDYPEKLID